MTHIQFLQTHLSKFVDFMPQIAREFSDPVYGADSVHIYQWAQIPTSLFRR